MKTILPILSFFFGMILWASCTKCSRCDVTVTQKAVGETKLKTFEKCGSNKDLKVFEADVEETYKPYGDDATVSCVRN